jgi:hypothetical protein
MDPTHLSHAARGSRSGAFTIMKLAGHSNVIVSQRYVHPTPESCELAFERLEALSAKGNWCGLKVESSYSRFWGARKSLKGL